MNHLSSNCFEKKNENNVNKEPEVRDTFNIKVDVAL